jgi:hypothetical protein
LDSDGNRPRPESPWLLLEGACVGAVGGVWLTAQSLFDVLLDDRISGVSIPTIHRFLATEYRGEVVASALELFALSLLVGVAAGGAVALAWLLRLRWAKRSAGPLGKRQVTLAGLLGLLFVWIYLYDVAARPALHQPELFARGGLRAWLQILVADGLSQPGVLLLGGGPALVYWLWPVRKSIAARMRLRPRRLTVWGALAVGVALMAWVCEERSSVSGRARGNGHPNVLVIAADSLRPDRLDVKRAPNIARLREQATSFERAYTPLARTFPAWVSMATGQYPQHHGIRHMFPRWEARQQRFDTVARKLSGAGYHTAVVGDFASDIFRRVDLGYQTVRTPTFTMRELVREHLLKNDPWLLAWVRGRFMRWLVPVIVEISDATDPMAVSRDAVDEMGRANDKPFFITVFYSTPHFPYATPGPHHGRFRQPGYSGRFRYAKADTLDPNEVMSEADISQVRALYDGAVYATDVGVGYILDALQRSEQRERTIVVITADHGEELYEYGRSQGHGDHLQGEEALRVPLVIFDPTRPRAQRYDSPVSLVDLAPTLLELTGVGALEAPDGRSLASALDAKQLAARPVYSETGLWFTEVIAEVPLSRRVPYPDLTQLTEVDREHSDQIVLRKRWQAITTAAKHRMVQEGTLRLLYMPTRAGPRFQLCDLVSDPACTKDSASEHSTEFEQLKTQFRHFVDADPAVARQCDLLLPREPSQQQGPKEPVQP